MFKENLNVLEEKLNMHQSVVTEFKDVLISNFKNNKAANDIVPINELKQSDTKWEALLKEWTW
jgi:hypothetical protein